MGIGGRIQGRCRITWTKTWGQVRVRLERGRQVVLESRARECGHTTYHASVMLQKHPLIMSTVSLKINPFTHQTSYSIQTIHLQNRPTVVSTYFQPPMALWVWPIDVEAVQQWTNLNSQSSKEKHIKGCNNVLIWHVAKCSTCQIIPWDPENQILRHFPFQFTLL